MRMQNFTWRHRTQFAFCMDLMRC
uniref:Uncharacterized protein n=1 Tax=Anguilla anguilla TaxID=7936 RepID=A0A0E9UJ25_ANGAN